MREVGAIKDLHGRYECLLWCIEVGTAPATRAPGTDPTSQLHGKNQATTGKDRSNDER